MDPSSSPRSRRSLLAAVAAAGGALATQALVRPAPAAAADVVLGAVNTAATTTTIRSNEAVNTAKALMGVVLHAGAGGSTAGVWGQSNALNGNGVFGIALAGNSKGVWGRSAEGRGVYGEATDPNVVNFGVYGESKSALGTGVKGVGQAGVRGEGSNIGVVGTGSNFGVYGSSDYIGVHGNGTTWGVQGSGATGIRGDGTTYGLSSHGNLYGLYADGDTYGIRGLGDSYGAYLTGTNYGVYAGSPAYAGWFNGKVHVTGALEKPGGSFLIDHPLDPANRTLAHSFVEAPERLNVYRGTVTLDGRGRATVRMPSWFRALNTDYSYQLTAIGAAAPGLHVARRIERGSFAIAGGLPGQDVCWLVTGVRQDAWAKANPLRVDRAKRGKDRGRYLNPEAHGKAASAAINRPPEDVRPPRPRRALRPGT
jgi:hypothetical protein